MRCLWHLPYEVIITISGFCDIQDLFSWAQTCRYFSRCVLPELYRASIRRHRSSALFWAARKDMPYLAKNILLEHKSDINVTRDGSTPFIEAAKCGSASVVRLMILKRSDLDINVQINGCSALWIAARNGHKPIVQILLQHPDIKIDIPGRYGMTPFGAAVAYGHLEVTKMLWNTGKVNINHEAEKVEAPLFLAIRRRDEDLCRFLLGRYDLSLECKDQLGCTPVFGAIHYNLISTLKELLAIAPGLVDIPDPRGRTPLLVAVENGVRDAARLLLHAEADPDAMDERGETPLSLALSRGKLMVDLLLCYRADINTIDHSGRTLLHRAVLAHCEDVIPILLHHGINSNAQDRNGCTALGLAITENYHPAIHHLIMDKHADLNATNNGYPALTLAIIHSQTMTVRLLCAVTALNPNQLDLMGQTPLNTAIIHHNIDLMNILLQRPDILVNRVGPNIDSPLVTAVDSQNRYAVQRLLQCDGINLNDGSLLQAVQGNHLDITKDLLEAGCDINASDEYGNSALMEAAKNEFLEILGILLQHREVDINARNNRGQTALWWAAHEGKSRAFECLLKDERISTNRLHHGSFFSTYVLRNEDIYALTQNTPLHCTNWARRSRGPRRYTTR